MTFKSIWLKVGLVAFLNACLPALSQLITLHSFTNTPDGAFPLGLTPANGLVFGVTTSGGVSDNGSIFTYDPGGSTFATIYSFTDAINNGSLPNNLLVSGNVVYGTAQYGGTNGYGMIYELNADGTGFVPLYSFAGYPDGQYPRGALILIGGTLYGTTSGGANGGTVFKINTDRSGYATLHSFTNTPDGAQPPGELVTDGGTLYGVTQYGGTNGNGAVFAISASGSNYTILHSFTTNGVLEPINPYGGLVLSGGVLYGTGSAGGSNNTGAIFAMNTNGTGFKVLHNFSPSAGNSDGAEPEATLTLNGGLLYGTTITGGSGNGGTIFSINTTGAGFAVVGSFTNNPGASGFWLSSGVTWFDNAIWGTTQYGGSVGAGTLFELPQAAQAPTITQQPQNYTVTSGLAATFTNAASGTAPLFYHWYFNTNTPVSGGTNAILTLSPATTNQAGYYTVVVTNLYGSATSAPAKLTVIVSGSIPVITQQPQSYTVTNGFAAAFTNAASGTAPLFYHWYFNTNTPVSGGTNAILTLSPATTNQAGYYTVVVTNLYGSATSAPAKLTVIVSGSIPLITQQPQNYSVTNGYSAAFTNVSSGTGPLFYQWYFNTNTLVVGGTNSILLLAFASTNQAGYYAVIVTNLYGGATSAPAQLTVIATKPIIFTQPQPLTVTNGDPVSFTVLAAGQAPLKYQWYTNSVSTAFALSGKTNSTVTFAAASNSLAGNYLVVITNALGKATSSPALLTLLSKPVITQQPQAVTVTNGDSATFTSAAAGAGVLSFQWFFRTNTLVPGATNTWLTLTNAITNLAGFYSVRVTNTFGATTSGYALLSVSNRLNFLSFSFDSASGSASFALANVARSTNRLWASSNLLSTNFWQAIATNVMATNGLWFFTDTNTAKTNRTRFYRFSTP